MVSAQNFLNGSKIMTTPLGCVIEGVFHVGCELLKESTEKHFPICMLSVSKQPYFTEIVKARAKHAASASVLNSYFAASYFQISA